MKVRNQGMLAMAAGAAAIIASGGIALADGMPGGPGYAGPGSWSGFYIGGESGAQWARFDTRFDVGTGFKNTQDAVVTGGIVLGYRPLVLGVEDNLTTNSPLG